MELERIKIMHLKKVIMFQIFFNLLLEDFQFFISRKYIKFGLKDIIR